LKETVAFGAELRPCGCRHGIHVEGDDPDVIYELSLEGFVFKSVWNGNGQEIGPSAPVATSTWRDLTDYGGTLGVDNSLHSTRDLD